MTTIPIPVQNGRYDEMNGTISAPSGSFACESSASVKTCSDTNRPTSAPPKRCTSSIAKRGQPSSRSLPESEQADQHDRRQQDVRDDPAGASRVPVGRVHAAHATSSTSPTAGTKRAARP